MKKIIIAAALAAVCSLASSGQIRETFDSNSWQWTEYSANLGKAYIIDGVMRLESKSDNENTTYAEMVGNVATHAYLPMDPEKGFEIKCEATVEKFEGKKQFGLILDYIDDMNCLIFMIKGDFAYLYKMKEGKIVGQQRNQFKLQRGKKKTAIDMIHIWAANSNSASTTCRHSNANMCPSPRTASDSLRSANARWISTKLKF